MLKVMVMTIALMLASVMLLPGNAVRAEADVPQVQWVGDVPINPALAIEPGLGFAFDSPEGRVVMVFLSGAVSAPAMDAYYSQALTPLGWDKTGEMRWLREGETLLINKTSAAGAMLWKITLRPE
ncbi:MAG: hypothetical protein ACON4P_08915 [Candidatus Puniceispirillales bacterium]